MRLVNCTTCGGEIDLDGGRPVTCECADVADAYEEMCDRRVDEAVDRAKEVLP